MYSKYNTGILRSDWELSGITWHTKLTSYLETKHYFLVEQAFFGRNGTIYLKIYKENFDVSSEGPSSGVASIGRQVDMWIREIQREDVLFIDSVVHFIWDKGI
jgi:hypothetical protein